MECLKPLKVNCRRSKIEHGTTTQDALFKSIPEKLHDGFVYAVFDHAICIGKSEAGTLSFKQYTGKTIEENLDFLQEIRIFNEEREFRAVRVDGQFRWRLRMDNDEGEPTYYLDETHKLWGKAVNVQEDDWTLLKEERGTKLWFPENIKKDGEKGIVIRQYLAFGQNSYCFSDERLIGFVDWYEGGDAHGIQD